MKKGTKVLLIILVILACISISLMSTALLDIDLVFFSNENATEKETFFTISGNISNYYVKPSHILIDFEISSYGSTEWNYSATDNETSILLPSGVIKSFNYSVKAGYPKYLLNVSWRYVDGGYGESNTLDFINDGSENISFEIEISKNKEIVIEITSPESVRSQYYQPEEFRSWIKATSKNIAWYMEKRLYAHIDAVEGGDYTEHKHWAEQEKERYLEALLEINEFKLSGEDESIRIDLICAFENQTIAMDYYMSGDVDTGGIYENIGADYLEEVKRKLGWK